MMYCEHYDESKDNTLFVSDDVKMHLCWGCALRVHANGPINKVGILRLSSILMAQVTAPFVLNAGHIPDGSTLN